MIIKGGRRLGACDATYPVQDRTCRSDLKTAPATRRTGSRRSCPGSGRAPATGANARGNAGVFTLSAEDYNPDPMGIIGCGGGPRCGAWNHMPIDEIEGPCIVLTVAHLNHTPEDCSDDNLLHLCRGCHNRYDAPVRRAGIKHRARIKCAAGDLFDGSANSVRDLPAGAVGQEASGPCRADLPGADRPGGRRAGAWPAQVAPTLTRPGKKGWYLWNETDRAWDWSAETPKL